MNSRKASAKQLIDALVDSVQALDSYYGVTGRKDDRFRQHERDYKKCRAAVRNRMLEKAK